MGLFDNTSFKLMRQGLDALWYKSQVIQQNVANQNTPGYKAKDVTFGVALAEQRCKCSYHTATQKSGLTNGFNLSVKTSTDNSTNLLKDGNNVDVEQESIKYYDTQTQYRLLMDKINSEMNMVKLASSRN